MPDKQRLDVLVLRQGFAPSREKAQAMIMAGEIRVNGKVADKSGMKIQIDAIISAKAKSRYVSRGGEKLAKALQVFSVNVEGCICADVGASTGGFTDCLLQHKAERVYAIDVGYGQLAHKLRQDNRVVVIERTNARYVESLDEAVNLVVVDASFISLRHLLPAIKNWLSATGDVIALIKPQFEAGREDVGKGGIVRDHQIHHRILTTIMAFAHQQGFMIKGLTVSPITGQKGNVEFLVWLGWGYKSADELNVDTEIIRALDEAALLTSPTILPSGGGKKKVRN